MYVISTVNVDIKNLFFTNSQTLNEKCGLIYQALCSTSNCHLETTHQFSPDSLVAGGRKERCKKIRKLASQMQGVCII
jgi:hypothetical protein